MMSRLPLVHITAHFQDSVLENAGYFFPIPRSHPGNTVRLHSRDSLALMAISVPPISSVIVLTTPGP